MRELFCIALGGLIVLKLIVWADCGTDSQCEFTSMTGHYGRESGE